MNIEQRVCSGYHNTIYSTPSRRYEKGLSGSVLPVRLPIQIA